MLMRETARLRDQGKWRDSNSAFLLRGLILIDGP